MCYCLRVDSSNHQGRWGSGIALLAAAPTIVRTARDAIRYRTPTDNFNFPVEVIIFFNFPVECFEPTDAWRVLDFDDDFFGFLMLC